MRVLVQTRTEVGGLLAGLDGQTKLGRGLAVTQGLVHPPRFVKLLGLAAVYLGLGHLFGFTSLALASPCPWLVCLCIGFLVLFLPIERLRV